MITYRCPNCSTIKGVASNEEMVMVLCPACHRRMEEVIYREKFGVQKNGEEVGSTS